MKATMITAAAAMAMALSACGPGAKIGGGKQGAAQALYAASAPTQAGAQKAAGGIELTGDVDWQCPKGGSATLSNFKVSVSTTGGTDVSQAFTMVFKGCGLADSAAGVAVYDGTMEVAQQVLSDVSGVKVEQRFKGHLTIGGAFNDFLDADVSQQVSTSALGQTSDVAMTLHGTLADSSGSYTYAEQVTVTGGALVVDTTAKQ